MTEGNTFAVECNWNWQFSQNVRNIFAFLEKINRFPELFWNFFEMAKGINFAVESEWKKKVSQNVQNLFCFQKIDGILEKRSWKILLRC